MTYAMDLLTVWSVLIIVFSVILAVSYQRQYANLCLPPGPKPIPFLGNVHQLPSIGQQKTFMEWGKRYGDLLFARLFHRPTLVINSIKVAQDLLDKRSAKYSYRPRIVLIRELMGWDTITNMTYDHRCRKQRKWISDAFENKRALLSYRSLQRREAYILLSGFFDSPELFMSHLRRYTAAMIMEITYGHTVQALDDKYIYMAERATAATTESGDVASMVVDFFPSLRYLPTWFPGAGFKRKARAVRKLVREVLDTPYEMVKDAMASGTARPCFTASLLEESVKQGTLNKDEEHEIKMAAAILYGGESESSATLGTFMLAMVLHPEVYYKARAEIDQVVGMERLPDFDDRDSLPYLECVIREVFRWNCPVPLGLPHKTELQDEYHGYDIPAGSMVIANIWAMMQNTDLYLEPDVFRPERFMEMDPHTVDHCDPRNVVFGFGRRICPGQAFADSNIWLAAACIIATVDLGKARDEHGVPITPPVEFHPAFISHPKDFPCIIKPRSEKTKRMVSDFITNHAL